jgi:hypothetical protein
MSRQPACRPEQVLTNKTEQGRSDHVGTPVHRTEQHRSTQQWSRDPEQTTTTKRQRSRADRNNQDIDQADQEKQRGSRSRQFATNQKRTKTDRDDQKAKLLRKSPTKNQNVIKKTTKMQPETTTQQIIADQGRTR